MKQLPPTYFGLSLLLVFVLYFILPAPSVISAPYIYLGFVLVAFGVVLNLWADGIFKKNNTTVKPGEKPTSLQQKGPFKLSRHPMYLGMASILLGAGVFLGSLSALLPTVFFIYVMENKFIPVEEKNLEEVFGRGYLGYKKKVRRWI